MLTNLLSAEPVKGIAHAFLILSTGLTILFQKSYPVKIPPPTQTIPAEIVVSNQPSHALVQDTNLQVKNINPVDENEDKEDAENKTLFTPDIPVKLQIPKIGLSSAIDTVGKDNDGRQSVPEEGTSVGWYKFGPKPGEEGNAVLAGHVATSRGPAIFYNLDKLSKGDDIVVTDTQGNNRTFKIFNIEVVKKEDFDVNKVYGKNGFPGLNLVTCNGTFSPHDNTYDKRIIIYSRLKTLTED